jgi:hypothetical protein
MPAMTMQQGDSAKKCGPGQTRRLTGTALGRVIVDGGQIKREESLASLCNAEVTAILIHRPRPSDPAPSMGGQRRKTANNQNILR